MKLGRLVIAGMFLAGSTSASAGFAFSEFNTFTKHELKMKLNGVEQGGDTFKVKQGDIGAALCGRELENKEELVVYVPCTAAGADIDTAEGYPGLDAVLIGVYNSETETPVSACDEEFFDVFNPVIELDNDGNVKTVRAVTDGQINPSAQVDPEGLVDINIYGTINVKFKTIKDDEGLVDGKNCAKSAKFESIFGYDDEAGEFILPKGNGNAKKRQSVVGTEILSEFE